MKKTIRLLLLVIFLASLIIFIWSVSGLIGRGQTQVAYEAIAQDRSGGNSEDQTSWSIEQASPSETQAKENTYTYQSNENTHWIDINPDFFGFIKIEGTRIDYPYVRNQDNEDYLNLDFYGKESDAGAIFMDYRNLGNFNDQHTVLYGHYMKNGTMFHNLTLYHDQAFLKDHPTIVISSLYDEKTFEIFSVYEISADDYALELNFATGELYEKYLESLAALSMHSSNFSASSDKRLLTLVTCSYGVDNGRTIIHAIER